MSSAIGAPENQNLNPVTKSSAGKREVRRENGKFGRRANGSIPE
jgi:hypothetical protein